MSHQHRTPAKAAAESTHFETAHPAPGGEPAPPNPPVELDQAVPAAALDQAVPAAALDQAAAQAGVDQAAAQAGVEQIAMPIALEHVTPPAPAGGWVKTTFKGALRWAPFVLNVAFWVFRVCIGDVPEFPPLRP